VRPLPRYTLAVMAAFVAFEVWVPLLGLFLKGIFGDTVPVVVQVLGSLVGLAVPTIVAVALVDYLADRPGLFKPYQPKPRQRTGTPPAAPPPPPPAEVD
jgi:hypothetical protein